MDENSLIRAIRNLDQRALTAAFDLYASALYKYALRLCRDPQEADNIVGDVFAQLLDQLAAGKGPRDNLRSYLYQVAYHLIVDRSRDNRHTSSMESTQYLQAENSPVQDQIESDWKLDLLQTAIDKELTGDQRHVITLRFLEGFDVSETSRILGKDVNNIKVIQSRAIKKLREAMRGKLEE